MRFLLDHTERAPEIPALARGYSEQMMLRAYLRWHRHSITRQRVRGIEWLTTRRDQSRGVVLSFMHHNRYDGLFASLARVGAPCLVLTAPEVLRPDTDPALKQHVRVVGHLGQVMAATGGTEAIAEMLRPGVTLAIASDVPGHTPVTFLGRRVLASFGAARIATLTNSPVVLVTVRRDARGSYLQLEQPLEPKDFASPGELLDEMLNRHSEAVLDWPEALDVPTARWGIVEH
ncbi:MAG: hypothetical protein ABI232_01105 [Jatrophihabitantaceae bacterium]